MAGSVVVSWTAVANSGIMVTSVLPQHCSPRSFNTHSDARLQDNKTTVINIALQLQTVEIHQFPGILNLDIDVYV